MRRLPIAALGLAAALAFGGVGRAQPPAAAAAYQLELEGAEPQAGLGATLPVRILDARDQTPVGDVRISGARLISPFGAVIALGAPAEPAAAPGVRLFRGDLTTPGAWTLQFAVTRPGRAPALATLAFTVDAPAPTPFSGEPAGASAAAADASGVTSGPAIAAPGPTAGGTAPPAVRARTAGYSPAAAPFCAACASEAPH